MTRIILLFVVSSVMVLAQYPVNMSTTFKTTSFLNPVTREVLFAPSASALLVKYISQEKYFLFGSFEYHKYSYLLSEYPETRPNFMGGIGAQTKNFSARLAMGLASNMDYMGEIRFLLSDDLLSNTYKFQGDLRIRYGEENILLAQQINFFSQIAYHFENSIRIALLYNGKRYPTTGFFYWTGGSLGGEIENNVFLGAELLSRNKEKVGSLYVQYFF
jgi:hypothetical protein